MIQKTIYDYLNKNLSVPCYMEEPKKTPDEFAIISDIDSYEENRIGRATISVLAYSTSYYNTVALAESINAVMGNITSVSNISHCSRNSCGQDNDAQTKRYRYKAIFDLVYIP